MLAALRSIGAVIAGFVVASVIMMIIEYVNGSVLHPGLAEAAKGVTDREQMRALLAAAPVSAFLVVIAGWILGTFVGALLAARLAGRAPMVHALVLGALIVLAGVANNLMLPPPAWFWPASLVFLLPAAYLGGKLVRPAAAA